MTGVTDKVRIRHCAHCLLADPEYGRRMVEAFGLNLKEAEKLSKMSHVDRMKATILM